LARKTEKTEIVWPLAIVTGVVGSIQNLFSAGAGVGEGGTVSCPLDVPANGAATSLLVGAQLRLAQESIEQISKLIRFENEISLGAQTSTFFIRRPYIGNTTVTQRVSTRTKPSQLETAPPKWAMRLPSISELQAMEAARRKSIASGRQIRPLRPQIF
jgi:hypothetical protein